MKNLKIICDSLSDIPKELIEKYDIEVVPLTVILNENEYRDGIDISNDEFYKILRGENAYPKTSQATYAQFKEVFDKYIAQGREILYIAGSSVATGTYQSAVMAKNDIDGEIYTYDSKTLTYLVGMLVVKAAQLAQEGKTVDEIIPEIDKIRDNTYVLFSVDTLEYLQKGGRISSTKAAIGSILNIKPILDIKNGLVAPVCQVRGKKNVISKMVDLIKENCETDFSNQTIYIAYSDDFKERERLTEVIKEQFNPKNIMYFQIGTVIGSHAGPGLTGVVCFKK
ncbi:MAG: DegV family protein [Romboutsia sp.]